MAIAALLCAQLVSLNYTDVHRWGTKPAVPAIQELHNALVSRRRLALASEPLELAAEPNGSAHGVPWRLSLKPAQPLLSLFERLGLPAADALPKWKKGRAKPQHAMFLQNVNFWLLMGASVACIAAFVIKIEVSNSENASRGAQQKDELAESGNFSDSWESFVHSMFCVVGLYSAMLFWGISQEFVMSHEYVNLDGNVEFFPSALTLVLVNRCFTAAFTGLTLWIRGKQLLFTGFRYTGPPALCNAFASWCQYESLHFVTFALQVTVKTVKLLPVVIVSSFRGKKHTIIDYMEIVVLVLGLVVFGMETEAGSGDYTATLTGLALLAGLICSDAFTPHLQDMMFDKCPELDAMSATFAQACFAAAVIMFVHMSSGMIFGSVGFVLRHPIALLHMTVLAMSSTVTQYLITYTIKHFGPVSFTIMTSIRQMIAVCISGLLFHHTFSAVAIVAMVIVFCTIIMRAVRPFTQKIRDFPRGELSSDTNPDSPDLSQAGAGYFWHMLTSMSGYGPLMICAVGLHVLHCFYAIAQEFLASHTFQGDVFAFPMFIVAMNHTYAALFAFVAVRMQGLHAFIPEMRYTLMPALTNVASTFLQHSALYRIYFPTQTLMKSLKIIPVMLVSQMFFKHRTYSILDWAEGVVITGLVGFFVWNYEQLDFHSSDESSTLSTAAAVGMVMMLGYVITDAFTCNLQDHIYQTHHLDPSQMLLGLEVISASIAWLSLLTTGELWAALNFLSVHRQAILGLSLVVMAVASGVGAYTCTLTVRLFGPAVFTLLVVCRQNLSLLISASLFQHPGGRSTGLCLFVVCLLVLLSTIRRVSVQILHAPLHKSGRA